MLFEIYWTDQAKSDYYHLKSNPSLNKRYKAVKNTIQLLAANPHHNSLQTHEYLTIKNPQGEKVFEAYAEQNTPAAYRVFWSYGPVKDAITIQAITRHL